ncbi:tetratricopeptide repeat protein [Caldalkalibacillus mannanilyticus]|uniref:tetratricopeptide repeat protein n=1 Tax=Caldalkalibacillus mannanilyticus TaxID=1418 RepID=UPI00046ADCD2|nr:tetratricopeptide repeat protein [Caldalkalibacillus mannanilyticus]
MQNSKRTLQAKSNVVSVPFDAEFFFERGVRFIRRKDVAKACKYFIKSVDLEPHNPKYLINLSAVYTEMAEYEESNRLLSTIVHKVDETFTECYYYMANNYAHLGDFDQAERYALMYLQENEEGLYVEEAEELLDFICFELERAPKELDVEHKLIGKHEKARMCLEDGKFLEATKILEEMVEEYPHFLASRNNLALSYYYLGQFDRAMGVIEEILEKDPTNLHALCNLTVFYCHKEEREQVQELIEGLKKVLPVQSDQHYKLATTLGIIGEDERAYELFTILMKRGNQGDVSLYHYVAVAAFNTKRWAKAEENWLKLRQLHPECDVAEYYLDLVNQEKFRQQRIPYHYQLPYDVQLKNKDWFKGNHIPKDVMCDPLIRSSLFWSLRHGDQNTKLQVIQSFEYIADQEVEEALRQLILDPMEEDYLKKVAVFVLRQIGAATPYYAYLGGEKQTIDGDFTEEPFPEWMSQWKKVVTCLRMGMEGNYDLLEHQEAQGIWTTYLRSSYPNIPKIRKAEGWAAAIEFMLADKKGHPMTKKEIATRYNVSVNTLTKNLQELEKSIFLDNNPLST